MMINNYILKQIMNMVSMSGVDVLKSYKFVDKKITQVDVDDILKEPKDEGFILLSDDGLELFLNGFIIFKRGPSNQKRKKSEKSTFSNNTILKKLKIALNLKDEDIINIMASDELEITKSQLTTYFRREGHINYRKCGDAFLKRFFIGYVKFMSAKV